jgi:hypothetical protein
MNSVGIWVAAGEGRKESTRRSRNGAGSCLVIGRGLLGRLAEHDYSAQQQIYKMRVENKRVS